MANILNHSSLRLEAAGTAHQPDTAATADVPDCDADDRQWYIFLLSGVFTFFLMLLLVLCGRGIAWLRKNYRMRRTNPKHASIDGDCDQDTETEQPAGLLTITKDDDIGWVTAARDWAGELISGQSNSGRILVNFYFLSSL